MTVLVKVTPEFKQRLDTYFNKEFVEQILIGKADGYYISEQFKTGNMDLRKAIDKSVKKFTIIFATILIIQAVACSVLAYSALTNPIDWITVSCVSVLVIMTLLATVFKNSFITLYKDYVTGLINLLTLETIKVNYEQLNQALTNSHSEMKFNYEQLLESNDHLVDVCNRLQGANAQYTMLVDQIKKDDYKAFTKHREAVINKHSDDDGEVYEHVVIQ